MDFRELLSVADYNKTEASHEASIKRFSSELPPPRKVTKTGDLSDGIAKFLAKRKAEAEAKAAEARKLKEKLLDLRSKSTKNSKKAKIMASRTKDNDFSRIKLTDDEVEAKKKREAELIRKNLSDKVERMKARIEMEEKEKLLPKKRKRKCKNGEYIDHDDHHLEQEKNEYKDSEVKKDLDKSSSKRNVQNCMDKSSSERKAQNHVDKSSSKINSQKCKFSKPPTPVISFAELLKVAEKKQYEPVEIVQKKKENEKPMTKKERQLFLEERERERRKKERLLMGEIGISSKPNNSSKTHNASRKPEKNNNPVIIHVEKDASRPAQQSTKFQIPKDKTNASTSKSIPIKSKQTTVNVNNSKSGSSKPCSNVPLKSNHVSEQHKNYKSRDDRTSVKTVTDIRKSVVSKKNHVKKNHVSKAPSNPVAPPVPQIDEAAITASIEKRIREKIEKELEEKLLAKFGLMNGLTPSPSNSVSDKKVIPVPKPNVKKESSVLNPSSKKVLDKPSTNSQKDVERMIAMKKRAMEQKKLASKPPEKKPFHFNPYLDPPRRLLEPQIRRPPPKRRIESSDDEEEDDMSDFIDDGPATQNEDDYSKYIKEIFGYDKNKYLDDDDDDIMESSFAQQMKEEIESAKAGIREDLEEERKEIERRKRKKLKK